MKKTRYKKFLFLFLITSLFISACTIQRSPITGDRRAYGFSWEKAKKVGAKADKQIRAKFGVYDNKELQQYVERVAEKVLAKSDLRNEGTPKKYRTTDFTFRILATPAVNAFALPGGYVYVTRGLLSNLRSEAQLAVVLGHEIGHVAARHASQSAFERQVSKALLVGGAVAGQAIFDIPGSRILQLGSLAKKYLFLSYSRDDEREADALGVEYASRYGYHTAAASGFFGVLSRMSKKTGGIPNWLSSHPDPSSRAMRIPELAERWRNKGYEQTIRDIDEYMKAIEGMVYGKNPRLGFTEDGNFFHPELEFYFPYPIDWKVINNPSVVQIINKQKNASILFQIDPSNSSPKASVLEFLKQDAVKATSASQATNHGLDAFQATATGESKNGQNLSFYLYAVEYNDQVYRFVAITLTKKFDRFKNEFIGSTNNFQPLTNEAVLNIDPIELKTYKINETATLRSIIPNNLPNDITAEEVAIMNQAHLSETIEAGNWVKIPQQ